MFHVKCVYLDVALKTVPFVVSSACYNIFNQSVFMVELDVECDDCA